MLTLRQEEIVRRTSHQHLREPEPLAEGNIPLGSVISVDSRNFNPLAM